MNADIDVSLWSLAKEGTSYLIVICLFSLAVLVIRNYPTWQEQRNRHEIQLKEIEFSKEEKVANIFDSALDKQSELISRGNELTGTLINQFKSQTSATERVLTVTDRTDKRCEAHGRILREIAVKTGVKQIEG